MHLLAHSFPCKDLKIRNPHLAEDALALFYRSGGARQQTSSLISDQSDLFGDTTEELQSISFFQDAETTRKETKELKSPMNIVTGRRETPLYYVEEVAKALFRAGGNPNALVSNSKTNYHFPFTWPPGTPLHWAVASHSVSAVTALLGLGASLEICNGVDPYRYDLSVRYLDIEGEFGVGSYSLPEVGVDGFTPIDLAAAQHDSKILRAIERLNVGHLDLSVGDEEGFLPIHRLSFNRIGRTVRETRFWYPEFCGTPTERFSAATKTIQALQALGSPLDILTKTQESAKGTDVQFCNRTPLMLAVTKGDVNLVHAFVICGAKVDAEN